MSNFVQTLRNLGPARLAPIAVVMLGLIGFFVYLVTRISTPNLALLYSDLDLTDSAQIVSELEARGIPYELRNDGSQVLIPADQVMRMRMNLAQEGLPQGGSVGNEIFDQGQGLGTSAFLQNINRVRALEGELSRTIASLQPVKTARVHLVLPERQLFSRDRQEPSASIVLQMKGVQRLTREQILSVQHLVASAVPGLRPSQISIIDNQGSLLARGNDEGAGGSGLIATNSEEQRLSYESRLAMDITRLLERVVGPGGARTEVSAEIDFDRVTTTSELYDPDGQVVRSLQSVEESADNREGSSSDAVSVQSNLPDLQGGLGDANSAASSNSRVEETINYEISKVIKQEVRETGVTRRLSVAVLVDGNYTQAEDGAKTYAPRSDEELSKIERLVKSAIGFDEKRGDKVEVVNIQFANVDLPEEVADEGGLGEEGLMSIVQTVVLAIVGILTILLIIRPLMTKLFEGAPAGAGRAYISAPQAGGSLVGTSTMGSAPQLSAPRPSTPASAEEYEGPRIDSDIDDMINVRQIEGQIKATSLKKISEIIDKHPEEALSVIRSWMYQES